MRSTFTYFEVYRLFQAILCSLLCSSFKIHVILTYPMYVQQIHILCKDGDGAEAHLMSMWNKANALTRLDHVI